MLIIEHPIVWKNKDFSNNKNQKWKKKIDYFSNGINTVIQKYLMHFNLFSGINKLCCFDWIQNEHLKKIEKT